MPCVSLPGCAKENSLYRELIVLVQMSATELARPFLQYNYLISLHLCFPVYLSTILLSDITSRSSKCGKPVPPRVLFDMFFLD